MMLLGAEFCEPRIPNHVLAIAAMAISNFPIHIFELLLDAPLAGQMHYLSATAPLTSAQHADEWHT